MLHIMQKRQPILTVLLVMLLAGWLYWPTIRLPLILRHSAAHSHYGWVKFRFRLATHRGIWLLSADDLLPHVAYSAPV